MVEPQQKKILYIDDLTQQIEMEDPGRFGWLGRKLSGWWHKRTYDLNKILELIEKNTSGNEKFVEYLKSRCSFPSFIKKKGLVDKIDQLYVRLKGPASSPLSFEGGEKIAAPAAKPELIETPGLQKTQITPGYARLKGTASSSRSFEGGEKIAASAVKPALIETSGLQKTQITPEEMFTGKILRAFDVFDIKNLPQNFDLQKTLQQIRTSVRRRDDTVGDPMAIDKIQHEARYIGVTEVAYKEYLCSKNPELLNRKDTESSCTWKEQIDHEKRIQQLLTEHWKDSQKDVAEIDQLLLNHPPLGSPILLAQIVDLYLQHPEKEEVLHALRKASLGVNSRRLTPLFEETLKILQQKRTDFQPHQLRALLTSMIRNAGTKEIQDVRKDLSLEEQKKQIIGAIDQDLTRLPQVANRADLFNYRILYSLGFGVSGPFPEEEREQIHALLQQLKEVVSKWEGPLPAFYHATIDSLWEKVASEGVLVRSASTYGNYTGAYVSVYPEPRYGGIYFCFSEDFVYTAQTTETMDSEWYGSNRAIPVNPYVTAAKESYCEQIARCFTIPSEWDIQKKTVFFMTVRTWLENWTRVSLEGGKFVIKFVGEKNLDDLCAILRKNYMGFTYTPSSTVEIKPSQDTLKTPLVAVFCGERRLSRNAKESKKTVQDIRQSLTRMGYPETLPVLDYKIGILLSYYRRRLGISSPARKREKETVKTINQSVDFF